MCFGYSFTFLFYIPRTKAVASRKIGGFQPPTKIQIQQKISRSITNAFPCVAVVAFCYDDYGANRLKRLSQMLLVCYNLLDSQSIDINNSKKCWLLGNLRLIKKTAELAQKRNNNWPVTSFNHNAREARTYRVSMRYS